MSELTEETKKGRDKLHKTLKKSQELLDSYQKAKNRKGY